MVLYSWLLEEDKIEWGDVFYLFLDIEDMDVIFSGVGYCKYFDFNGVFVCEDLRINEFCDFFIFKLEYKF